jgi:hypothetical protein
MNAIGIQDMQGSRYDFANPTDRPEPAPPGDVRHVHHAREFGIGYGNSSGYGSALHFTDGHEDALFKFRW